MQESLGSPDNNDGNKHSEKTNYNRGIRIEKKSESDDSLADNPQLKNPQITSIISSNYLTNFQ